MRKEFAKAHYEELLLEKLDLPHMEIVVSAVWPISQEIFTSGSSASILNFF